MTVVERLKGNLTLIHNNNQLGLTVLKLKVCVYIYIYTGVLISP